MTENTCEVKIIQLMDGSLTRVVKLSGFTEDEAARVAAAAEAAAFVYTANLNATELDKGDLCGDDVVWESSVCRIRSGRYVWDAFVTDSSEVAAGQRMHVWTAFDKQRSVLNIYKVSKRCATRQLVMSSHPGSWYAVVAPGVEGSIYYTLAVAKRDLENHHRRQPDLHWEVVSLLDGTMSETLYTYTPGEHWTVESLQPRGSCEWAKFSTRFTKQEAIELFDMRKSVQPELNWRMVKHTNTNEYLVSTPERAWKTWELRKRVTRTGSTPIWETLLTFHRATAADAAVTTQRRAHKGTEWRVDYCCDGERYEVFHKPAEPVVTWRIKSRNGLTHYTSKAAALQAALEQVAAFPNWKHSVLEYHDGKLHRLVAQFHSAVDTSAED